MIGWGNYPMAWQTQPEGLLNQSVVRPEIPAGSFPGQQAVFRSQKSE
jgi:hypothetical protein